MQKAQCKEIGEKCGHKGNKMEKQVSGECHNCESTYDVSYVEELTSDDYPQFCPFCGEAIEELSEHDYIDDDDDAMDNGEWN